MRGIDTLHRLPRVVHSVRMAATAAARAFKAAASKSRPKDRKVAGSNVRNKAASRAVVNNVRSKAASRAAASNVRIADVRT